MNIYEKLWNEKKRELAKKVSEAPNPNAATKESAELAEMILQESKATATELKINPEKWEEAKEGFKEDLQKCFCKGPMKIEIPDDAKFEELRDVAEGVIEFLNKHYDPHTMVLIAEGQAVVTRNELFCILPVRD